MADSYPFPQDKPDHPSNVVLREWWHDLEQDKGERAALRRAGSLTQVMLSSAFHRLLNALRKAGYAVPEKRYPNLAAIAGMAARLKGIDGPSLGTQCGTGEIGASKAAVTELRMRRILACDDIEDLYTLLRRAIALLDEHANLADLAATVWNWKRLDENHPFDPRRRMALDYYAAAPL